MNDKQNAFFTYEEVSLKLKIPMSTLYNLVYQKRMNTYQHQGNTLFYRGEIDGIENLLESSYSFKEIVEIVQSESNVKSITRHTVKNYMERHFGLVSNPINGKDYRFYKKDKERLIELINEQYTEKGPKDNPLNNFLTEKKNIPFIDENVKEFVDYEILKSYAKSNYKIGKLVGNIYTLKHIIGVCNERNINMYTNQERTNIYIHNRDFDNFKGYYRIVAAFDPNNYYTNEYVKNAFEIVSTEGIAKFTNAIKIKNNLYFNKEKIDELLYIKENTVSSTELSQRYNIPKNTLKRWLDELEIEYIPDSTYPYFQSILVFKKDVPKLEEKVNLKTLLSSTISYYEKFKLETEGIILSDSIPLSIQAFDDFILQRYKDTSTKYVHTNLVNVYKAVFPNLTKEITQLSVEEVVVLAELIPQKVARTEFASFVEFCKRRYLTKFKESISFEQDQWNESEPYTFEQWKKFALLLFTKENELISKCIEEKNRVNAMVWLYCALHYVCAWRTKDIINMPYPDLELVIGLTEEEVIENIQNGTFTIAMAQSIVNNTMFQIKAFHTIPSKSKRYRNTQRLKFEVSDSYVYTIGMLIALCEAHRRLAKKAKKKLITTTIITERVTKREQHIKFFGEKYIEIFGDLTFTNNSANKTYFNFVQVESQKQKWGQGYDLASILRGHRKNKMGIAPTTEVYLKHINKSNDVHQITETLAERGSFGFMSHLLLNIIHQKDEKNEYSLMNPMEQAKEITNLYGLKPKQIELMVKGLRDYRARVTESLHELITNQDKKKIKDVLEKISLGTAPSKMMHSQCLLKTIDKSDCLYPKREHCIGCDYQMNEMYFLMEFNEYLQELLHNLREAKYDLDKKRFTYALFYVFMPIMQEAISYFGKDRVRTFVKFTASDLKELQQSNQLSLG